MCFGEDQRVLIYCLALLNSSTSALIHAILSPGVSVRETAIGNTPVLIDESAVGLVNQLTNEVIALAQSDWDSFEGSWGFVRHPLVRETRISDAYALWESECRSRFDRLKVNEEELNRIFAHIYHLEDEVPIEVPTNKITIRLADTSRDARSLISYGIGCMFGRYSTEVGGLVLADQGTTVDDFLEEVPSATYLPDEDNVLPVLGDEWFDDDVVAGFRQWIAHTYGEETVDENMAWLERSIGKDLRSYLVRDFYADHLKVYQKRPIYWMFQSPKKSFQCLVYMHRYDEGTVGTILTGYLRPLEEKLRARLQVLESPSATAADTREANKVRGMIAELEQWEREVIYPLAHERVSIDLDDGVKVNYNKFPKALAKVTGLSEWK